jgi:hypothetical protein
MSNEINLLDKQLVTQIIREIEATEDKYRKRDAFKSWQIYSGNGAPYITQDLQAKRPKSYKLYPNPNISISKLIIDKVSKAYKSQPIRKIDEDQVKNERLLEIYKQGGAHRQLPYMDTITNLQRYSLTWVNYLEDKEQYQFMSMQPYEYSVIRDKNTGELTCVILNYGNRDITSGAFNGDSFDNLIAEGQGDSSSQSRVYAMWSKDHHIIVKVEEKTLSTASSKVQVSVTYVKNEDNLDNINKLGVIPFVFVSKDLSVDYPNKNPISDQTITFNYLLSEMLAAATVQVGQMVVKYPDNEEGNFDKLPNALNAVISLPQPTDGSGETSVEYIQPSPDLAGQKETFMNYLRMVLSEHGIETGSSISGDMQSFSSGLERAIANASVQDIIESNQEMYVDLERKMFRIIKAYEALINNQSSVFKDEDELQVIFKKPKVLISDAETLANIEKRLSMGLMEEYEALMELDPNLSEKEAKKKLETIRKSKLEKAGSFFGNTEGNSEEDNFRPDGDTDEQEERS